MHLPQIMQNLRSLLSWGAHCHLGGELYTFGVATDRKFPPFGCRSRGCHTTGRSISLEDRSKTRSGSFHRRRGTNKTHFWHYSPTSAPSRLMQSCRHSLLEASSN